MQQYLYNYDIFFLCGGNGLQYVSKGEANNHCGCMRGTKTCG